MDRVLVVCTANLVRSPVAEAALKAWAQRAERPDVEFSSAGVAAVEGRPVPAPLVQAIRPFFLNLYPHRSRRVTRELVREATLVLAMTEAQREALQALLPSATSRVFTLCEFARLTSAVPPVSSANGGWAALVGAAHRERPRRPSPEAPEDVADPYGGSVKQYQACIKEIVGLVDQITARLS
jgi:protein-tyrosine phosphatase